MTGFIELLGLGLAAMVVLKLIANDHPYLGYPGQTRIIRKHNAQDFKYSARREAPQEYYGHEADRYMRIRTDNRR